MHKIEYYIDGKGLYPYMNGLDPWMGELDEEDYKTIAENCSYEHATNYVCYDLFPCGMELVPEFTASRINRSKIKLEQNQSTTN